MAINYHNAFKEVINTLAEIIKNETKLPVHFDSNYKNRGTQYFNIKPVQNSVVSRFQAEQHGNMKLKFAIIYAKGITEN